MFLKTSISTTKKLFQKTLDGVKSFFSSGYQKLPKSPAPCSPLFSCAGGRSANASQNELEKYYTDFTNHWDCKNDKSNNKKITSPVPQPNISRLTRVSPRKSNYQVLEKEPHEVREKRVRFGPSPTKTNKKNITKHKELREERSYLVAQKLKELKRLEKSNEEHALDIEEVLHYYSKLTCPAYVEIVDKFFMEMYTELFNHHAASSNYGFNNPNGLQRVKLY